MMRKLSRIIRYMMVICYFMLENYTLYSCCKLVYILSGISYSISIIGYMINVALQECLDYITDVVSLYW